MRTFNCARVYVGDYSCGYISFMPQDDTFRSVKCGYEVVSGEVTVKRLTPVRVRGAQDSEGDDKYHVLETVVLYPATDTAVVAIHNTTGKHMVTLAKYREGTPSTIFKARL